MKYRGFILKTDEKDLSVISEYIVSDKKEYVMFEFEEKDITDILDCLSKLLNTPLCGTLNCLGENDYIYEISADGVSETQMKASVRQNIKLLKRVYRYNSEYKKQFSDIIENCSETGSIAKKSLLKFESRIFVSKESKIAFNYRIKKAKTDNKPLVIFLHGGGCIGIDNIKPLFEYYSNHIAEKLKKYDCNILIPQFPYYSMVDMFSYSDPVKQLSEFIADETNSDKNRIYIFGTSFGGHRTWESAYDYPDYYACAMSVMGALDTNYRGGVDYEKLKQIPILVAHASDDKTVPVERNDETVKMLEDISSNIKYIRWNKYGHRMVTRFYKRENWDKWMFTQSLEKR